MGVSRARRRDGVLILVVAEALGAMLEHLPRSWAVKARRTRELLVSRILSCYGLLADGLRLRTRLRSQAGTHHGQRAEQLLALLQGLRVDAAAWPLLSVRLVARRAFALVPVLLGLLAVQTFQLLLLRRAVAAGIVVRVAVHLLDDQLRLLGRGGRAATRRGELALRLLELELRAAAVLRCLLVARLSAEHHVQVCEGLRVLAEPPVGDAAAQVRLSVGVVDLHRGRAVGERLAVLLELQVAHAAVGVDDRVVLLQPEGVRVCLDRRAVIARLIMFVALGLLVHRAALSLRSDGGQAQGARLAEDSHRRGGAVCVCVCVGTGQTLGKMAHTPRWAQSMRVFVREESSAVASTSMADSPWRSAAVRPAGRPSSASSTIAGFGSSLLSSLSTSKESHSLKYSYAFFRCRGLLSAAEGLSVGGSFAATAGASLGGAGVALVPRTGGSASVELTATSILRRAASRSFRPDKSRSSIGGVGAQQCEWPLTEARFGWLVNTPAVAQSFPAE